MIFVNKVWKNVIGDLTLTFGGVVNQLFSVQVMVGGYRIRDMTHDPGDDPNKHRRVAG